GFDQYLLLADLYRVEERYADAIHVCQERIKRGIDRKGLKGADRKRGFYLTLVKAAESCVVEAVKLAQSAEGEELLNKAQEFINDATAELPGAATAMHMQGRILLARGKDLEAVAQFEKADQAYPTPDWENKGLLAALYLSQGQIGAARQAAEVAVRYRRASAQTWLTYARILLAAGQPKKASEAAATALHKAPEKREGLRSQALRLQIQAYERMDRPDLVQQALQGQDQGDPRNALILAQTLAMDKHYVEALDALSSALEADPANIDAVRIAAACHSALEKHQDAQAVVQRALQAKPSNVVLQKLALALEQDLSQEERDRHYLAMLNNIEDQYVRASELAQYYLDTEDWEQAETQLAVAKEHLDQRDTPEARDRVERLGERAIRDILDKRFVLFCTRKEWGRAEQIASEAKERNIDGVDGLTYFGRLQLLQANPELAVDSLSQALDRQPNNSKTLTFLGQAYLDLKRYDQARETFERAVAINPNNGLAHKGLAILAAARLDEPTKREHLNACKRLIPNDRWVKEQLALLEERLDPTKGIQRRLKRLEQEPEDYRNLLGLARNYMQLDPRQPVEARKYYDQAVALVPGDLAVAWEVARFHRQHGGKDRALQILHGAVDANDEPADKAEAQMWLGRYFQTENALEQAEAAYLAAADMQESAEVCAAIGRFFFSTGRRSAALDWFDRGLAKADEAAQTDPTKQPLGRNIRVFRVECLTALEQFDPALQGVEELLARYPHDKIALLLRAEIERSKGEVDLAVSSLNRFLEQFPDSAEALYRRANLYVAQGRWSLAIEDLERVKARAPKALDLKPRMLLARAYDRTGRFDLASSEIASLLDDETSRKPPRPQQIAVIANALIGLYVDHRQYDQADRQATIMINRQPDEFRWLLRRGDVAIRRRDPGRAIDDLLAASTRSDFNPTCVARLMEAYREFRAYDQGILFYEQTLPTARRNSLLVEHYATLLAEHVQKHQGQAGHPCLLDVDPSAGDAAKQYRLAVLLLPRPDFTFLQLVAKNASDVLGNERALGLFRTPPEDRGAERANRQILGVLLAAVGQTSEGITVLQELLGTVQNDTEKAMLSLVLGILSDQTEDYDNAREFYRQVLKLEPEQARQYWVASNNLAYLLSDKLGQHESAKKYARDASMLSGRPDVADTYGMVLTQLGDPLKAVGVLTKAIQDDPTLVEGHLHLAEAYRRLGKFRRAEDLLNEAQKLIDEVRERETPDRYLEEEQEVRAVLEKAHKRDSTP
ncbi:MAG: tetratricopeptide repeat protein, partial [Planctomycetota bacterium]